MALFDSPRSVRRKNWHALFVTWGVIFVARITYWHCNTNCDCSRVTHLISRTLVASGNKIGDIGIKYYCVCIVGVKHPRVLNRRAGQYDIIGSLTATIDTIMFDPLSICHASIKVRFRNKANANIKISKWCLRVYFLRKHGSGTVN